MLHYSYSHYCWLTFDFWSSMIVVLKMTVLILGSIFNYKCAVFTLLKSYYRKESGPEKNYILKLSSDIQAIKNDIFFLKMHALNRWIILLIIDIILSRIFFTQTIGGLCTVWLLIINGVRLLASTLMSNS